MSFRRLIPLAAAVLLLVATSVVAPVPDRAQAQEVLDPAHNIPLPCEAVSTPGLLPRSARDLQHVANICGFVGTDLEFQSRVDASGATRDYVFLGTMGAGLRIFDITDPEHPTFAGAYTDPGWQNDVQVRGDLAVIGFDPVSGAAPTASLCLRAKGASGGEDLVRLLYDTASATFTTQLIDCVSHSPGGGAHNSTLHPDGQWLAVSNPRGHGSVDVVDLRGATPVLRYRIVQNGTLTHANCVLPAPGRCVSTGRDGTWSPHDIHFSRDGRTMYVAAVGNDTVLVDVRDVLVGGVRIVSVVPNDRNGDGGVADDAHDISISHQSDVTPDGKILIVTDERGGGLQETRCNTDPSGVIGGAHFWALGSIGGQPASQGASPATPKRLGAWFYPAPPLAPDPLDPTLRGLVPFGRGERGCTIHVLRIGGNGSSSPGPAAGGLDGVSRLSARQFSVAHYGAGVWLVDFSKPASSNDRIAESPLTTWGNTIGWNVMPGADTWSGKEYKGYVYAGDMARGFDVFRITPCVASACKKKDG
ncbi:MAG TPA: hypothetical protein VJP45_13995 [Candidatus Limnocylindria bacterium]|nr:hypothetical protein [Candidatus Limnocylindria bacterium]